jgi:hypothetical protein
MRQGPQSHHACVAFLTAAAVAACGSTQSTGSRVRSSPPATAAPAVATSSSPASSPAAAPVAASAAPQAKYVRGAVRYRLPLHDNPVDRAEALRCYSSCRHAETEASYVECLSGCPGFEVTADLTCGPDDGLPNSVCLLTLPPEPKREADPVLVAGTVLGFAMILSLPALCSASGSQCYGWYPSLWRY